MAVMDSGGDFDARDGIVRLKISEGGAVDGAGLRGGVRLRIAAAGRLDMIVVAVFAELAFRMPRLDV